MHSVVVSLRFALFAQIPIGVGYINVTYSGADCEDFKSSPAGKQVVKSLVGTIFNLEVRSKSVVLECPTAGGCQMPPSKRRPPSTHSKMTSLLATATWRL